VITKAEIAQLAVGLRTMLIELAGVGATH